MSQKNSNASRRDFIKKSSAIAAAGTIATGISPAFGFHNSVNDTLKVGLIGCGGRGTAAVGNALAANPSNRCVAIADAFMDRAKSCMQSLKVDHGDRCDLPEDRVFDGFDCYKKLLQTDVDIVILATPPHFRPEQFRACVAAGKHVFVEKPVGVDVPGVLSVLETSRMAKKKGLAVVSGLCWRYDIGVNEVINRIMDGEIGDILSIQENYLTGTLWHRGDKSDHPEWSEMEYQLRNWLYFNWLSGDHIAEQHIHSLDKAAWLMGDTPPVSAVGTGGRLVRTQERYGNVYDHFSTVYEWENGVKVHSNCRQMAECHSDTNDYIIGSKGNAEILSFKVNGNKVFKGKKPSMYDAEHAEMFKSILNGDPINNGEYMCNSTLIALMGRDACYTGSKILWKDYIQSDTRLGPEEYKWGDYKPANVAKPAGQWKPKNKKKKG